LLNTGEYNITMTMRQHEKE